MKPARKVRFNFLSTSGEPLANVLVAGVSNYHKVGETRSADDGSGILRLPVDANLTSVLAFSQTVGLDYFLFRALNAWRADPLLLSRDHQAPIVFISPTATVIGKLVDRKDEPLTDKTITYGILFNYEDNTFSWRFGGECVTRADGTFTLPGLIVGKEYKLQVARHSTRTATPVPG